MMAAPLLCLNLISRNTNSFNLNIFFILAFGTLGELWSESCAAQTAERESKGPKAKLKKMFKLKLFVFRLIKFRHNRGAAIISKHTLYFKKK